MMRPIEVLARHLCKEDGRHPDGTYGEGAPHHWEDYERDAKDVIDALASEGYSILPVHPPLKSRDDPKSR